MSRASVPPISTFSMLTIRGLRAMPRLAVLRAAFLAVGGLAVSATVSGAPIVLGAPSGFAVEDAPKPAASKAAPEQGLPTDAKAARLFAEAGEWQKKGYREIAIDTYRKANKQDGGHCVACLNRIYSLAISLGRYKDAEDAASDLAALATTDPVKAFYNFQLAVALERQGVQEKKDKCFAESCDLYKSALDLDPNLVVAHYTRGVSLAYLHRDDEAKAEFAAFVQKDAKDDGKDKDLKQRAQRYMERVELARATMAPPFSFTTVDGKRVSMDDLAGKVVLIDFWATWCPSCVAALPNVKRIAARFANEPFVVLSISLDSDEGKWRTFIDKNKMTWLQYRDRKGDASLARIFEVHAIPATFSIDADGVLEDQHVGEADIERKLEKMIKQAKGNAASPAKSATAATAGN